MQTADIQPATHTPISHADLMALYKGDKSAGLTDAKTFREWLERSGKAIQKTQPIELRESIPTTSSTTTSAPKSSSGKAGSKTTAARAIFKEELDKATETGQQLSRKHVLGRFVKEAGMSPAGANTYYQNFRDEFNLVKR